MTANRERVARKPPTGGVELLEEFVENALYGIGACETAKDATVVISNLLLTYKRVRFGR